MKSYSETKVVKTICNLCHERCGMNVFVQNGRIIRISGMREHFSHDLCPKGYASSEFVYSKDRLKDPLMKTDGKFHKISWDEAFSYIADKLTEIRTQCGPQALVTHLGVPFVNSHTEYLARRFCDLYGTPNYTSGASFCYLARTIAHLLTFGGRAIPNWIDSPDTGCIIIWGNNLTESNDPFPGYRLYEFLDRGTKLMVVDPRRTELAKNASLHAQIRPGTDGALALGMLHVIINEQLYDRDFVERWTVGFDALADHVQNYPPEKVEKITWVESNLISKMARTYASNKPAQIAQGISMDHCTNGIQALRAIAILTAITGNLDVPGGEVFTPPLRLANLRVPQEKPGNDIPGIGAAHPVFSKFVGEEQVTPVIEQMLTEDPYPIKGLIINGCNPALTWPNTHKFSKACEKLRFFMVIDIFMTETAQMADIVLPGTSFLERDRIKDYATRGLSMAALANQAVKPIGSSMLDWQIWAEMGKRIGYGKYFPWKNTEELFEYLLDPTGIDLHQLQISPSGTYYAKREFRKYLRDGFNTPSRKVEIYSQLLEDYGYDPLPTHHEPSESPESRQDLVDSYPMLFIGGPKKIYYTHSEHRNFPALKRYVPEPTIEINPQAAARLGIENGDRVQVDSPRGTIFTKAELTADVHPRVLVMQHGWAEANANLLTDDKACDPISGFPGFRSVLCRIKKMDEPY